MIGLQKKKSRKQRVRDSLNGNTVVSTAMQKNPNGESRIPTDMWSGMGFSKSMPESAIRDRLGQLSLNHGRFDEHGALPAPSEYGEVRQVFVPVIIVNDNDIER